MTTTFTAPEVPEGVKAVYERFETKVSEGILKARDDGMLDLLAYLDEESNQVLVMPRELFLQRMLLTEDMCQLLNRPAADAVEVLNGWAAWVFVVTKTGGLAFWAMTPAHSA